MMNTPEAEETIWRLTRQYVEECETGLRPNVQKYLAAYPQYAADIADFVAYYHAVEARTDEVDLKPEAPGQRQTILKRALRRAQLPTEPVDSLFPDAADTATLSRLARDLDISEDVLLLLERRRLLEESVPTLLVERLAFVLQRSEPEVRRYLRGPQADATRVRGADAQRYVAEERSLYAQEGPASSVRSFLQAIEESPLATPAQKEHWRKIVAAQEA